MQVERVRNLSASDFRKSYVLVERPVIVTDAIDHWPARELWNPEYLKRRFGHVRVQAERLVSETPGERVAKSVDGTSTMTRLPGNLRDFEQREMTLGEYFDEIAKPGAENRWYLALQPLLERAPEMVSDTRPIPYFSELLQRLSLQTPLLWMGPEGSVANLHFDKLPNIVVQIHGRKKWTVLPSWQMKNVYLPSDLAIDQFSPVNVEAPDLERFPLYRDATPIEFVLGPGEMLFLPTHWPHHVRSLDFSISMNFWWIDQRDIARLPGMWLKHFVRRAAGFRERHYGG
jgi:ribosomal protein L16 Arg81 hydroxylase